MSDKTLRLSLSVSQKEIWLDQHSFPGSPHLNVGGYGEIHGSVNIEFMIEAVRRIAAESDALRLIPDSFDSQTLIPEPDIDVVVLDFTAAADPDRAIREYSQKVFSEPLSLGGRRPPWRVTLLKAGGKEVGMLTQFHHILMDGWGSWLFYVRWGEHYTALCEGREPKPGAKRSYSEAIQDTNRYMDSPGAIADRAFWKEKFQSIPQPVFEQRHGLGGEGVLPQSIVHTHRLSRKFYDKLIGFAEGFGVIPYQVFLAVLVVYFAQLENRDEIVIGVPCLNRGGRRYKETLGMFASVLPLRIPVSGTLSGRALISEIASELRDIYRRQRFPLSEIGRSLKILEQQRDRLFDVVFSFEKNDFQIPWGEMIGCNARQVFSGVARYPLVATVCEFEPDQDVELVFEASSSLFSHGEVELLGHRLRHLLEAFVEDPDRSLQTFDIVSQNERSILLGERDASSLESLQPPTFIELFSLQAQAHPDAIALVWAGGELAYGEVDRLSTRLSEFLLTSGVRQGHIVAISMDRAPEVVVSLLAVAKAGAAYLMLDPDAPEARTNRMLEAIDAPVMLIQKFRSDRLSELYRNCHVVDFESAPMMESHSLRNEEAQVSPIFPGDDDLAYVVFTSGSTGEPKGVKVSHRGLSHRLDWLARHWKITPSDRSGQVTQLTFDPCLIELLLPLTQGASVALPPPGRRSAEELASFFATYEVTFCVFVPTTLRNFLDAVVRLGQVSLRFACCGGDALPAELCDRFRSIIGGALFNLYGPSEASIFVTAWESEQLNEGEPVPLGRALEGVKVYVLDVGGRLLPIGSVGEIHLGGAGLTPGYLGRPDLDEQAFVPDPFHPGARLYRSGDRGYIGVDGNLHFLGRLDRQIKLRGYRIELGEIESALRSHPHVDMAVAGLEGPSSSRFIHAWVTQKSGGHVSPEEVMVHLRGTICDYMVPSSISVIDEFPTFSNGKIDHDALPQPQRVVPSVQSKRPFSELERQVALLWEATLETSPIGARDDFFQLGGDSLTAVSLLDKLESVTGHRYPLTLITEHPCFQDQVAAISQSLGAEEPCVELSSGIALPILYIVASGNGDLLRFRTLAKALTGACSVRMLQPPITSLESLHNLGELSAVYCKVIRGQMKESSKEPLWVAGFSVGGVAALETVRSLESSGIACKGLILLDTVFPRKIFSGPLGWGLLTRVVRIFRLESMFVNGRNLGAMLGDPGLDWQVRSLQDHRPLPCQASAKLIVTSGLAMWKRWLFDPWTVLFRNALTISQVPGVHGSIFEAEKVDGIAVAIIEAMGLTRDLSGEDSDSRDESDRRPYVVEFSQGTPVNIEHSQIQSLKAKSN